MTRQLPAVVIAIFRDADRNQHYHELRRFSAGAWQRNFHWLDASGLALYFLHRLTSLDIADAVPASVLWQLQERQRNNRLRTNALFKEAAELNIAFRDAGLHYANLKGFTLAPEYCPDLSLRCQTDCDFLIDHRDPERCGDVLKTRGYSLIAANRHVMEFKTDAGCTPSIRDLYKPRKEKSVEVHLCSGRPEFHLSVLERARLFIVQGVLCPALSDIDMFLAQAFHLFRHLRSEWTRVAWLLEFRHFAIARHADTAFWDAARERAAQVSGAALAIGVVVRMAEKAFGAFAPVELTSWSCPQVRTEVGLWIERYGDDVLLADFPGSKLYLILERAISGDQASPEIRRRLFPRHVPAAIVAAPSPALAKRLLAASARCGYFLFRLRFHITAGFHYFVASWRWRHLRPRAAENGSSTGYVVNIAD